MSDWKCNICKEHKSRIACTYCDDGSEFEIMTNADRIRSMTDEELAEFILNLPYNPSICENCQYNKNGLCCVFAEEDRSCTDEDAKVSIQKWLDSEV